MKIKTLQAFSSSDITCEKGEFINVSEARAKWLVDNGYCEHLAQAPTVAPPVKPPKKATPAVKSKKK